MYVYMYMDITEAGEIIQESLNNALMDICTSDIIYTYLRQFFYTFIPINI
jgi:hypothetical protein